MARTNPGRLRAFVWPFTFGIPFRYQRLQLGIRIAQLFSCHDFHGLWLGYEVRPIGRATQGR
jgi:hypothetical protein